EFGDNVYTWGCNKDYQLGIGKRINLNSPGSPLPIFTTAVSELANQSLTGEDAEKTGVQVGFSPSSSLASTNDTTNNTFTDTASTVSSPNYSSTREQKNGMTAEKLDLMSENFATKAGLEEAVGNVYENFAAGVR